MDARPTFRFPGPAQAGVRWPVPPSCEAAERRPRPCPRLNRMAQALLVRPELTEKPLDGVRERALSYAESQTGWTVTPRRIWSSRTEAPPVWLPRPLEPSAFGEARLFE